MPSFLRPLGDNAGQPLTLRKRTTSLGRAEDNDVQALPRSVSGYHAEVQLLDGGGHHNQAFAHMAILQLQNTLNRQLVINITTQAPHSFGGIGNHPAETNNFCRFFNAGVQ